jgi:PhnB protein
VASQKTRRSASYRRDSGHVVPPNTRESYEPALAALRSLRSMTDPTPYLHLPGTTREALTFYSDVFDCEVHLHTFTEFNRNDRPADAIAHGYLAGGPVALFAADVSGDDQPFRCEGMMLSLLGTAEPSTLRDWFSSLADGGQVVDDLQKRPWGASDGQVIDRYGVHWLIGFEGDEED